MENLKIGGHSMKFFDRHAKSEKSGDCRFTLNKKLFALPAKKQTFNLSVGEEANQLNPEFQQPQEIKVTRKFSADQLEETPCDLEKSHHVTRRLKKPAPFKDHYADRQTLPIKCFSFPRLGENFPFRGRQTLCKYYNNEILNEDLLKIKSAESVKDLEKLFEYYNSPRRRAKSADVQSEYYDCQNILKVKRPSLTQHCFCQFANNCNNKSILPVNPPTTTTTLSANANAIKTSGKKKTKTDANSIDDFIRLASQCYHNYIQCHFKQLDLCNRRALHVREQQLEYRKSFPIKKQQQQQRNSTNRISLAVNSYDDLLITNKIHIFDISNSNSATSDSILLRNRRQSLAKSESSLKIMNDSDNVLKESTNQLVVCGKEPPKIVLSDHSESDSNNNDINSNINKHSNKNNLLTVPITNYYCSEARPP